MTLTPIGPLARTDDTPNATNQPGDHNTFQQKIDQIIAALALVGSGPPLDSFAEAYAGLHVAPGALRRWLFSQDRTPLATVVNLVVPGDSTVQGGVGAASTLDGFDTFAQQLGRALGPLFGGQVGYGFRSVSLGLSAQSMSEWDFGRVVRGIRLTTDATNHTLDAPPGVFLTTDAGSVIVGTTDAGVNILPGGTTITSVSTVGGRSRAVLSNPIPATVGGVSTAVAADYHIASDVAWTRETSADPFDVAPQQEGYYPASGQTRSTCVYWTKPSWMSRTVVAFDVLWGDGWAGGNGFEWSVDDGVTWTAQPNPGSRGGGNKLKRSRIVATITKRLTLRCIPDVSGFNAPFTRQVSNCTIWSAPPGAVSASPPTKPFSASDNGSVVSIVSGPGAISAPGTFTFDLAASGGVSPGDWGDVDSVSGSGPGASTTIQLSRNTAAPEYAGVPFTTVNTWLLVGVVPWIVNPNTARGFMPHMLGRDASTLAGFVRSGGSAGDPMAILDDGTTHPGALNPRLIVAGWTNDIGFNSVSLWQTCLATFAAYTSARKIDVLWWGQFDRQGTSDDVVGPQYRQAAQDFAANNGWGYLDVFEAWGKLLGTTGYDAAFAAGLMYNALHEDQDGHNDLAARFRRALMLFS